MFDSRSLVSTHETAAVLALMARRTLPWNRVAGEVEEEGSALGLLERIDAARGKVAFASVPRGG